MRRGWSERALVHGIEARHTNRRPPPSRMPETVSGEATIRMPSPSSPHRLCLRDVRAAGGLAERRMTAPNTLASKDATRTPSLAASTSSVRDECQLCDEQRDREAHSGERCNPEDHPGRHLIRQSPDPVTGYQPRWRRRFQAASPPPAREARPARAGW